MAIDSDIKVDLYEEIKLLKSLLHRVLKIRIDKKLNQDIRIALKLEIE